jgi:hypothetical protein
MHVHAWQSIHFPLVAVIDYRGHRVLATACLPGIADPRDMMDINKRTKEQCVHTSYLDEMIVS